MLQQGDTVEILHGKLKGKIGTIRKIDKNYTPPIVVDFIENKGTDEELYMYRFYHEIDLKKTWQTVYNMLYLLQ